MDIARKAREVRNSKHMATKRNRKQNPNVQSKSAIAAQERKAAEAEAKKERQDKISKIAVGAFAVVMALSMMLPSLVALVQQPGAAQGSGIELNMEMIDSQYGDAVSQMDAKLESDPKDTETLQQAGSACLTWASYARLFVQSEDDLNHVNELYDRSIGYFDRYLEIQDSDEIFVNRSLARYYAGKTDEAVKELEGYSKDHGEYAPLWAYLGIMYEAQENKDAAREAYNKAIDLDSDGAAGALDIARERLDAMDGKTAENTTAEVSTEQGSAEVEAQAASGSEG